MAKSFSPAGMAIKAFFGLGARTFGNPDGNKSGSGAWSKGKGGGGTPITGFDVAHFATGLTGVWDSYFPIGEPSATYGAKQAAPTGTGLGAPSTFGAMVPVTATLKSAPVAGIGWDDSSEYGWVFVVVVKGTVAQNFFTSIQVEPYGATFDTATATAFTNSGVAGFSAWFWSVAAPVPASPQTVTVT